MFKKSQKSLRCSLLILVSVSLLVGLGAGLGANAKPTTYGIGFFGPITGGLAYYGDMMWWAMTLHVDKVNAAGGINGVMVELIPGDNASDPKEAAALAHKHAGDPRVHIVVGGFASVLTFTAQPIFKLNELVHMSVGTTHIDIARLSPWNFRVVYHDEFQTEFLAKWVALAYPEVKRVAMIYELSDYNIGVMEGFRYHAPAYGIEFLDPLAYPTGTTDFIPLLIAIKGMEPDALFVNAYHIEAGLIMKQARAVGLELPLFFGADSVVSPVAIEVGGEAIEGLAGSIPFVFDPAVAPPPVVEFVEAFRERWGTDPDWVAAHAYDAVGLAMRALEAVGADRKAIREYLAGIDTYEERYEGITGSIVFDEHGDVAKPAFMVVVKEGEWVMHPVQVPPEE